MNSFVCVLSTDSYLDGVLILNENLKELHSKYPLLCLINDSISEKTIQTLEYFNISYQKIEQISYETEDEEHPHWRFTFDKLNVFSLTKFEKIVVLDVDILILQNIDSLFEFPTPSMARDYPWKPDKFSSGIMVVSPNQKDYNALKELVLKNDLQHQKIGDQDIINQHFKKIHELSRAYNVSRQVLTYKGKFYDYYQQKIINQYLVHEFVKEMDDMVILHYAGQLKPFMLEEHFHDIYSYQYAFYMERIRRKKELFEVISHPEWISIFSVGEVHFQKYDSSKFIAFVPQNYHSEVLVSMIEKMEKYHLDFCEANISQYDGENRNEVWENVKYLEGRFIMDEYHKNSILPILTNKVFRRSFYEQYVSGETEKEMFDSLISYANRVLLIDDVLY